KQLAFGPFVLDITEKQLLRDHTPLPLTPKAFELLVILIENPRRLLEKKELMDRLWPDTFVEEANLSNNISLLRKVLGEGSYIETVPRRGYRFLGEVTEMTAEPQSEHDEVRQLRYPRSKWIYYVASIVVLVIAATAGWHLLRRSDLSQRREIDSGL